MVDGVGWFCWVCDFAAWLCVFCVIMLCVFSMLLLLLLLSMSWLLIGAGSVLAERLVRAAAVHQQWHVQQFRVVLCECIRYVARVAFAWRAFDAI